VSTAYSRVTVVNGARRIDLALPRALPLSDVFPKLLGYCAPEAQPDRPAGWALARLGGADLRLADSLAEAGITDGEVLELRTGPEAVRPAYVEDVRDTVEDTIDAAARPWQSRTTVGFTLAAGGTGLALAALLPAAREPRAAGTVVVAVLVAGLLAVTGWWAQRRGHPRAAPLVLAVAALWGGVAGWSAATFPAWPPAAAAGAAGVGAALVAALARALTPAATGHLAGLSVLTAATAGVGVTALAGADPLAGVRVVAVGAVLLVGVLPRVSLAAGGLAGADYRVRQHGQVSSEELARRIATSTAWLSGGMLGTAIAGAGSGALLIAADSAADRSLGAAVGLALVLRSRVFSQVPQILPGRVAGLLVLALAGARVVSDVPALRPGTVPLAAVAMAAAVAVSAVPLSEVARARVRQLLDRAELVAVAVVIVLAAVALGGFGWVSAVAPS
jgi:type VII secretion integral membrane protein EccD